jgi:hypothetical protein
MSDYRDYRVSQARSERIREQAKRQKRMALLGVVALVAIVAFLVVASSLRGAPVTPPNVVVTWPSPQKYGKRLFVARTSETGIVNLGSVLMRRKEPFTITLQNAANWDATIVTAAATTRNTSAQWKPDRGDYILKIFARKQTSGWRKMLAWTQPKQELRLIALDAKSLDANRRELEAKSLVWLSQTVTAGQGTYSWDQRAIPLLHYAFTSTSTLPAWNVIDSFRGERAPEDKGSYFKFFPPDSFEAESVPIVMTQMARKIAERAPDASIKWIINDTVGILRLEFDGSGARGGWVKRAGETEATPLRWWSRNLGDDEIRERLAPSSPR